MYNWLFETPNKQMNIPNVRINRILENYLKETHTIPTITIAKPHVVVFSSFFFWL